MSVLTEWIGGLTDSISFMELENKRRIEVSIAAERRARLATLQAGSRQAGQARTRGSQLQGTQRVAFAANNLDASSGTAVDLQASSAIFSEMDAETAQNNARAAALGHDAVIQRYEDTKTEIDRQREARTTAFGAAFAKRAINFTGSALGGAGGQ